MHEGAGAPSYSIRSGGMYAARSGPGGRFIYHFLAAAEGSKKIGRNPWGSLRLHGHMEGAGDDFALLSLGKLVEIDRVARYPDGQAGIFLRVVVGVQQ